MNLIERLTSPFRSTSADKKGTPMREAAGTTVDADDDNWRRLTGDGQRDLSPMTQARMQKLAHYLWEANLLANRMIELPVAYLLAQGVAWRIDDEKAQEALNRHWNDGLNAWAAKLPKRVRELAMFGEQCWRVFLNPAVGYVRLGNLDPSEIETVVVDPENREQPIGIVTRRDRKGVAKRYRVIVNVPESAFAEGTQAIRETFADGDCFYFRVNDLSAGTRGRSDLLAQIDWLDAYDVYLFGEVDRAQALRAHFWDVTVTGASPEEVKKRAREITSPPPGATRVHNEGEVWKAEAPSLGSHDAAGAARLIRNHMLGGATIPETWYGGAEDVNRSTAENMAEPTEKMLDMRQQVIGHMLLAVAQFVVRAHWHVLDRELTSAQEQLLDTLRIEWPELTTKDTSKYATALAQVVSSASSAITEGLLSRETALRLIAKIAARLGVEIDPADELADAAAEAAARGDEVLTDTYADEA